MERVEPRPYFMFDDKRADGNALEADRRREMRQGASWLGRRDHYFQRDRDGRWEAEPPVDYRTHDPFESLMRLRDWEVPGEALDNWKEFKKVMNLV